MENETKKPHCAPGAPCLDCTKTMEQAGQDTASAYAEGMEDGKVHAVLAVLLLAVSGACVWQAYRGFKLAFSML